MLARIAAAQDTVSFNRDVLPILSQNCFSCHGFDQAGRQASLRLDTADGLVEPADSGEAAVVPGHPEKSELIRRILSQDPSERMPPPETEHLLSESQKQILTNWVAAGAPFQPHWAFIPPGAIPLPKTTVAHPIDSFVQSRLDQEGIEPSPRENDAALLRRVSLDLVGLPPTLEELETFLQQSTVNRQQAYLDAVNRLLDSPHYGERWARWWLDQARYADSNGYSIDAPRQIWKFRDWVVESLNADQPFDQFTIEQLAGDLLPAATQRQQIATGFHRNTQINQEGGIDKEQFRVDSVFDRVATTGTVWLGLTIGCAQCHDHKFDPISQTDFYRMFAFFNNQEEPTLKVYEPGIDAPELASQLKSTEAKLDAIVAERAAAFQAWESSLTAEEISKMSNSVRKILATDQDKRRPEQVRELFAVEVGKIDSEFQDLLQTADELQGQIEGVTTTLVMQERSEPRQTTVLIKGDFTRPATAVTCGTPSVLHEFHPASDQANRLDLANWIVDPNNPLTARVIVNRVWQVYFGKGIVETENDFGSLGSLPTHPELLDWLAREFQGRMKWSLKELHRTIVTSHTYCQSSVAREDLAEIDPNNYLLARQQRLRLEAEIVRDTALAASGLLSLKMGGPPVFPPIPDGVMNLGQIKRSWKVSAGEDRYRRGLYTFVYRATPPPSLNVFDAPDGFSTCTRRSRSNTPLQALTLLNDAAFFECAQALAERVEKLGAETVFRVCTARIPTEEEMHVLEQLDANSVARVLLNLDETVTRE
ncbi:MAG: DUF1553 domain-containing protein [Planctomycetales bacterium]|nr:DUF1553 domain-containing protein [Planctomycetales bacterium]